MRKKSKKNDKILTQMASQHIMTTQQNNFNYHNHHNDDPESLRKGTMLNALCLLKGKQSHFYFKYTMKTSK